MIQIIDKREYDSLRRGIAALLKGENSDSRRVLEFQRVRSYWEVGHRLSEAIPMSRGGKRAAYGRVIVPRLASDLDVRERLLYEMLHFFRAFSKLPTSAVLGWSHYRCLLRVGSKRARSFYSREAERHLWSVRQLDMHIEEKIFELSEAGRGSVFPAMPKGRLYVYRMVEAGGEPRLDLGFDIRCADHLISLAGASPGDVVESARWARSDRSGRRYGVRKISPTADETYTYAALVSRVVDGDTLVASVDLGFGMWLEVTVRLRGIDAPELPTARGLRARDHVQRTLGEWPQVVITSRRWDKYRRCLADLYHLPGEANPARVLKKGRCLNEQLVDEGLAARYGRR